MKDRFVDSFVIFKYTIVYCRIMCTCTSCNQMCVSFFSRRFLIIIESILGKNSDNNTSSENVLFILKKSMLTYVLKICTQYVEMMIKNIVNSLHPLLSNLPDRVAYLT